MEFKNRVANGHRIAYIMTCITKESVMFLSVCVALALAESKNEKQVESSTSDVSRNKKKSQELRIEYLVALAHQLEEQKYIDEAIEAYHRLFVMTKKGYFLQKQSLLYREKGDYERALKILEKSKLYTEPSKREAIEKEILEIKSHLFVVENASTMNLELDIQQNLYQDTSKLPKITLLTVGTIGFLGGIVMGVEASKIRQNLHSEYCFYSGVGTSVCTSEAQSLISRQQKIAALSDVGWFLTFGSLGTAYYLTKQDLLYTSMLPYSGGM